MDNTTLFAIGILLTIGGCATIDYSRQPPMDWPKMDIVPIYGDNVSCQSFELACAKANFDEKKCYLVFRSKDVPDWVYKHEEAHCLGYNHVGDNVTTEAFEKWKKTK